MLPNRVFEWPEKFKAGDHSDDRYVLDYLKGYPKRNGIPLLFSIVLLNKESLTFLKENGVNLLQRADDGRTFLGALTPDDHFDLDAYRFLSEEFSRNGAIDWAEEEGITPLSSMIKFGGLDYARILLENGASIHAFASIARYGGRRLDIPTQAIICSADSSGDAEQTSIEALKLLQEFGYRPSPTEATQLYEESKIQGPRIAEWISENLLKTP